MLSQSAFLFRHPNFTRAFASTLKDYPINGFFDAKTYAIIGASEKKGSLGYNIAENFLNKFNGKTYFVNPKGILYFCAFIP
jgi:predicted CoA-binding protein